MTVQQPVVCLVPGDLHLTEPGMGNHRTALWVVGEANDLIRPDFVQFIGDNVQDATEEQFGLFRALADQLRVPWYALVGDHDVVDDPRAMRFRACVGESCGTLSLRGFRFLRLNTQEGKPVGLSAEQLAWLRMQMDQALSAGERVVLFQHNYPYKVWETFDGPGIDDWRAIVQTRRVTAILTGHTHYGQTANDGRNVVVATRSIGDPEGGPPGYTLASFQGEDLALTYRTVEDRGPVVLITHPRDKLLATGPNHVVRGPDQLRVRIWSSAPLARVESLLDGQTRLDLRPLGEGVWGHSLPGENLRKGDHTLEARALDAEGHSGRHEVRFVVDGGGRFTAVPGVHPPVAGTAFC